MALWASRSSILRVVCMTDTEMRTAENMFREYLRKRGLKFTPERKTLLHEVLKIDQHFEAEARLIPQRCGHLNQPGAAYLDGDLTNGVNDGLQAVAEVFL